MGTRQARPPVSINRSSGPHAWTVPMMPPAQHHVLLSNTGRSSDSQARPVAAFSPDGHFRDRQAMARTQPAFSPDAGKTSLGNRPNTAAGPSRNRTGVPCLPSGATARGRPPGSCIGMYGWRRSCQAPPARPLQPSGFTTANRRLEKSTGCIGAPAESVTVVRRRAAWLTGTERTAIFAHPSPQVV